MFYSFPQACILCFSLFGSVIKVTKNITKTRLAITRKAGFNPDTTLTYFQTIPTLPRNTRLSHMEKSFSQSISQFSPFISHLSPS